MSTREYEAFGASVAPEVELVPDLIPKTWIWDERLKKTAQTRTDVLIQAGFVSALIITTPFRRAQFGTTTPNVGRLVRKKHCRSRDWFPE
jgi:hypothetical protein